MAIARQHLQIELKASPFKRCYGDMTWKETQDKKETIKTIENGLRLCMRATTKNNTISNKLRKNYELREQQQKNHNET